MRLTVLEASQGRPAGSPVTSSTPDGGQKIAEREMCLGLADAVTEDGESDRVDCGAVACLVPKSGFEADDGFSSPSLEVNGF